MERSQALALVRKWTAEEFTMVSYGKKENASEVGKAYSIILECKYSLFEVDTEKGKVYFVSLFY
jgi:hypothetical protein